MTTGVTRSAQRMHCSFLVHLQYSCDGHDNPSRRPRPLPVAHVCQVSSAPSGAGCPNCAVTLTVGTILLHPASAAWSTTVTSPQRLTSISTNSRSRCRYLRRHMTLSRNCYRWSRRSSCGRGRTRSRPPFLPPSGICFIGVVGGWRVYRVTFVGCVVSV